MTPQWFDDPLPRDRWQQPGMLLAQWAGVLLGPFGWALHLQVSYTLATFACDHPWRLSVHVIAVAALALALGGAALGWRNWRVSRDAPGEGHRVQRSRFMALAGILLGAYFALVIVAQWIPTLFIEPCRY